MSLFLNVVLSLHLNQSYLTQCNGTLSDWLTFLLGSIFDFHMSQLLDKIVAHNVKEVNCGERKSLLHMIGGEAALPA